MKAIYVSPVTEILHTEISPVMANRSPTLSTTEDNTLLNGNTQKNVTAPETGGNEERSGGEDDLLEGAKRNWNCWDIE